MSVGPRDLTDKSGPAPTTEAPARSWPARLGATLAGFDRLDRTLLLLTIGLAVSTAIAIRAFGHGMHVDDHGLDLILDAVTTIVTAAVAGLAWVWFREQAVLDGLFRASAFLVATVANAYALVMVGFHTEGIVTDYLIADGQVPLWTTTLARLLAALALVAPAIPWAAKRGVRHPAITVWLPSLIVIAAVPVAHALGPALPPLSEPFDGSGTGGDEALPASTALGTAVQASIAVLFLAAAVVTRDGYRRTGSTGDRYIAVALVFAAFAQFNLAFFPGTYPGLVAVGDLLRLAFDVTLLLAVQAEATLLLRRLRQANRDLQLLRDAEADRAALEERARLSRELHDGVAQDLWLAKLKASRLAAMPELGAEAAQLTADIQQAVDAGLAEAQQAVTALRPGHLEGARPLSLLLAGYVDDFGDRFGIRVQTDITPDVPRLPSRTEAEVLRIAQEALTNVRRHADATVAWVSLWVEDDRLVLTVRDNGCGFEPALVGDGYGLAGMRERAALVGGTISIESRPSEGTTLVADIPVDPAVPGGSPP